MLLALERVLSPTGFPYASGFHLFKDAHFGRDSLEVAEDLLEVRPDIALTVIHRLADLQGIATDRLTEEEPGKIHHEYRALTLDGKPVDAESRAIFRSLAQHWRLADSPEALDALTEQIYYGTVDATPLYVRLVARYCAVRGKAILDAECNPRNGGKPITIRESVRRAVEWIVGAIEGSDLGLLEFRRMNPKGHRFQAWKDGTTSYLHTDGTFANYNGPIASIEVQGLAYDALMAAPALLDDDVPVEGDRLQHLGDGLREAVLKHFWMPDEQYFAMALDREPDTGAVRQIRTITSNPAALLDSGIFDRMPGSERERVVGAIVRRIYGDEFLTPVGVRCTSLRHQDMLDYAAYQSSHTVWHKETYDIAKGLRDQGFPNLAGDLETRLLNAINLTAAATEFLYVLPDGCADLDPFDGQPGTDSEEIFGTNIPENDQAWSISAALAIKWRRGHGKDEGWSSGWQRAIEDEKRRTIPPVPILRSLRDIEDALEQNSGPVLNIEEGWRRETAFVRAHELPARSP